MCELSGAYQARAAADLAPRKTLLVFASNVDCSQRLSIFARQFRVNLQAHCFSGSGSGDLSAMMIVVLLVMWCRSNDGHDWPHHRRAQLLALAKGIRSGAKSSWELIGFAPMNLNVILAKL